MDVKKELEIYGLQTEILLQFRLLNLLLLRWQKEATVDASAVTLKLIEAVEELRPIFDQVFRKVDNRIDVEDLLKELQKKKKID